MEAKQHLYGDKKQHQTDTTSTTFTSKQHCQHQQQQHQQPRSPNSESERINKSQIKRTAICARNLSPKPQD